MKLADRKKCGINEVNVFVKISGQDIKLLLLCGERGNLFKTYFVLINKYVSVL